MHRFRFTYSRTRLQALRGPQELAHGRPIPITTVPGTEELNDTGPEIQAPPDELGGGRYQLSTNNPFAIFENPEYHANEIPFPNPPSWGPVSSVVTKMMRWIKLKLGWSS